MVFYSAPYTTQYTKQLKLIDLFDILAASPKPNRLFAYICVCLCVPLSPLSRELEYIMLVTRKQGANVFLAFIV